MQTATHYLPAKDGVTPQLWYRVTEGFNHKGEKYRGLAYYSNDFETWQGTNESDIGKYIKEKLIEIPGWQPHWQGPKEFIQSWVKPPMKSLVSSTNKNNIEKYKNGLNKAGIKFEEGMDPHYPQYYLLAVHEGDYPRAMNIIYPNRLIPNKVIKE